MLHTGMSASVELVVGPDDTAAALGSGTVLVLATPRVLALVEAAAVAAVAPALQPGETTVGTRVELDHLLPTHIGQRVTALVVLEVAEGRRLSFRAQVVDETNTVVARGVHTRAVVDEARFATSPR